MNDGALVKVTQTVPGDWADAEQSSGSEGSVVPTGPEGGEPATLALRTWKDSQWEAAPNGTLTDVGKHPVVTCQGGTIVVWEKGAVAATWTTEGAWAAVPKPTQDFDTANPGGQLQPTVADDGAIFLLDGTSHLRKLDLNSGKYTDTGLELESTSENSKSFLTVTVAESGTTMFACSGRATGLPGGPTTPGTACRFAPAKA